MWHGRTIYQSFRQEVIPTMKGKISEKRWRLPFAVLCQVLVLHAALAQPSVAQARLSIVVTQGEGTKNIAQQIAPKPLIVRVLDANNRPVEGAAVTFTAPQGGPTGDFSNDSKSIRVPTDANGVANAGPFHPNANEGAYQIQVRAEFQGAMASTTISQANIVHGTGHKKLILIIAIAGAAAGAAVAAHSGSSSSSSSSSSSPTITLGGTAVGAPH
jgi:hypothetical protein